MLQLWEIMAVIWGAVGSEPKAYVSFVKGKNSTYRLVDEEVNYPIVKDINGVFMELQLVRESFDYDC